MSKIELTPEQVDDIVTEDLFSTYNKAIRQDIFNSIEIDEYELKYQNRLNSAIAIILSYYLSKSKFEEMFGDLEEYDE